MTITGAAAEATHTVEEGDTLQLLADLHDVSVEDLAAANGLNVDDAITPGEDLIMPGGESSTSAESGDVTSGSDGVKISGIPTYKQSRSLSCEAAAVYIATSAFGDAIPEDDTIEATPKAANPHEGFRGDYDGPWGETNDYGVYAEALVPHIEAHGFIATISYGADPDILRSAIDAGEPTLIWIATHGDTGFYDEDENGTKFKLVPYEHVVVAFGYDDDDLLVSDPGSGAIDRLSWGWLLDAWAVLDGMALSIQPG
jgi:LysM repeat protein